MHTRAGTDRAEPGNSFSFVRVHVWVKTLIRCYLVEYEFSVLPELGTPSTPQLRQRQRLSSPSPIPYVVQYVRGYRNTSTTCCSAVINNGGVDIYIATVKRKMTKRARAGEYSNSAVGWRRAPTSFP